MIRFLTSISFCFLIVIAVRSQCDPPPVTCPCEVVPICGFNCIDDYSLDMTMVPPQTNPTNIPGCGGVFNNPSWFAFVAGSNTLSIEIVPFNCDTVPNGPNPDISGIQVVLYGLNDPIPSTGCGVNNTGCDPQTLNLNAIASNCGCDIIPNSISFNGIPTVPGQTYYIVIDGCGGSVCNPVEINVTQGGDPPAVDEPGAVILPPIGFLGDTVCPGATDYNISLDPVVGAGFYSWFLPDGSFVETIDPELLYTFPEGEVSYGQEFDFCVRAHNDCVSSMDSTCFTIVVAPLDTIFDADITLCEGESSIWRGVVVGPFDNLTSDQSFHLATFQNNIALYDCQFIAAVDVHVINENDENPTAVDFVICDGQSISVFGVNYTGNFTDEIVQGFTTASCDSFVSFTLTTIDVTMVYQGAPPSECINGMFTFIPTQSSIFPDPSDPLVDILYEWRRVADNQLISSSVSDIFQIDINDFLTQVEVFQLTVIMQYDNRPIPACEFVAYDLVVDLANYTPSDPIIVGPDSVCVDVFVNYSVDEVFPHFTDPTMYTWDFTLVPAINVANADPLTGDLIASFDAAGGGRLCVTVNNNCTSADTCIDIVVTVGPNAGPDEFSCGLTYGFAAQVFGTPMWSVVSTPSVTATAMFDDVNLPTATVTVNEPGAYAFGWGDGNCADDITITFVDTMQLDGPEAYICDNTNTNYTLEFNIIGGLPPYTVVSGNGSITGSSFTSGPIPSNTGVAVVIEDDAGCQRQFTFNTHGCSCETDAGTMVATLLESCGVGCHQGVSNLDTMMDANDVFEFILHDQPGQTISTALDRNTTGEFCFNAGILNFNQIYYISMVIGDDLGGGTVDLTEGCTRVAAGQSVIWYSIPNAMAVDNLATCADSLSLSATPSVGVGAWTMTSGPGTATFFDAAAAVTGVQVTNCGTYQFQWVEDNNGCRDSVAISAEFYCNPEVVNIFTPCDATATAIDLTINLTNGQGPYTEDNNRGTLNGTEFTLQGLPLNTPDTFYFTDDNGCMLTVPVDIADCACISVAGTMDLTPVQGCQDQELTVIHAMNDVVTDANDSIRYVVHTRADDTLGTLIVVSNDVSFFFSDAPFVCDSVYYVSAIVGNWDGSAIDLSDPCLSVAPGVPFLFDCLVLINAGNDIDTCATTLNLVGTTSTGSGTWTSLNAGVTITMVDAVTGQVNASMPGTYVFEFTSQNGNCSSADQVTFTVFDAPTVDPTTIQTVCNADNDMYTVTFTIASGDLATYTIVGTTTGVQTGNTFTSDPILSGDVYSFEVFDINDCARAMVDDVFTCACLTQTGVLTASTFDLCEEESVYGSLSYDNSGEVIDGNDVLNYILSDNATDPASSILRANTTGNFSFDNTILTFGTTYYIAVILGNGTSKNTVDPTDPCLSSTGVIAVTWYDRIDQFSIDADALELTCQDQQVSLSILTTENLTGYTILWSSSDGSIEPGDETMPTARVNTSGTYILTISHPVVGCDEQRSIMIGQSDDVPVVVIIQPEELNCDFMQRTILGTGSSTGLEFSYTWTGPGIVGNNMNIDVVANIAGVYTLTITNTANGCSTFGNISLDANTVLPAVAVSANESLDCNTSQVTVSGLGSSEGSVIEYTWIVVGGQGNIVSGVNDRDMVTDMAGDYQLTVRDASTGCENQATVTVSLEGDVPTDFEVITTPIGCSGVNDGTITADNIVGGIGPFMYSFDGGQSFGSSNVQSNLGPDSYSIVVQDANGCDITRTASLDPPFDFFVDLGGDQTFLLDEEVVLTATTNLPDSQFSNIVWLPLFDSTNQNSFTQIFTPAAGAYTVSATITNTNGCSTTGEINFTVQFQKRVYVPTALHPEGLANDNQYLNVYADAKSVAVISSFRIFNRWGGKVFERTQVPVQLTLNRNFAWDGTDDKGEKYDPGIFTYFVEVEYVTGVKEVIRGTVTLVR